jgi:hypothetical protein
LASTIATPIRFSNASTVQYCSNASLSHVIEQTIAHHELIGSNFPNGGDNFLFIQLCSRHGVCVTYDFSGDPNHCVDETTRASVAHFARAYLTAAFSSLQLASPLSETCRLWCDMCIVTRIISASLRFHPAFEPLIALNESTTMVSTF